MRFIMFHETVSLSVTKRLNPFRGVFGFMLPLFPIVRRKFASIQNVNQSMKRELLNERRCFWDRYSEGKGNIVYAREGTAVL